MILDPVTIAYALTLIFMGLIGMICGLLLAEWNRR